MSRTMMARAGALASTLVLAAALGACGSSSKKSTSTPSGQPGAGKPAVVLGDKNFPEEYILGALYQQALKAKGYKVTLKGNIGSTEVIDKALTSGKIDAYPEYTGTVLSVVKHQANVPKNAADTYAQAKAFQEARGFTLTAATPFEDKDSLATTVAYATKNGLSSVADLAKLGSKVTLGADPPFRTRFAGLAGLKSQYGLNKIVFKGLTIGLPYQGLDQGKLQAADVFTTDGQLLSGKYKLLADPKGIFGFQNVAMVVSKKVLAAEGPAFAQTIDAVSAKLTAEAIQKMNAAVVLDKQDASAVAKKFLAANGLT